MREVQVLQATKTAPNSRGRNNNYAVQIDRIRVAAYCRVSTDGDEQLGSFESQKLYYEEKIRKNKEWAMAGIFADEAITGTKIDKREGFQEMIRKCLNGEIDMILTNQFPDFPEIHRILSNMCVCSGIRILLSCLKKKISIRWI